MSAGPIKQWRDSFKPPVVSTPNSERVCAILPPAFHPYCGRRKKVRVTLEMAKVNCADCMAAIRADAL